MSLNPDYTWYPYSESDCTEEVGFITAFAASNAHGTLREFKDAPYYSYRITSENGKSYICFEALSKEEMIDTLPITASVRVL